MKLNESYIFISQTFKMDNMKLFGFFSLLFINSIAFANGSISSSIDCTEIEVNFIDDPKLTKDEKIKKMDDAFYESLNQFELCQFNSKTNESSDSLAGDTGSDDGLSEGQENINSMADTEMSGVEKDADMEKKEEYIQDKGPASAGSKESEISGLGGLPQESGSSGKPPEDIPSADNDDAVAAQIRLAAEIEKDPVKKDKLWNEYRKYKGLPTK
tara:strand:+ start:724 stop:1365 length:642 start_codon:yes stop_codon:yes gene_type:complete